MRLKERMSVETFVSVFKWASNNLGKNLEDLMGATSRDGGFRDEDSA
jgi:hypothetical protein